MHGPWHMPEHPDEHDDGGAQERAAYEALMELHADGDPVTLDDLEDAEAYGWWWDAPAAGAC